MCKRKREEVKEGRVDDSRGGNECRGALGCREQLVPIVEALLGLCFSPPPPPATGQQEKEKLAH